MQTTWDIIDGKIHYNGKRLADWIPEITDKLVATCNPTRVIVFGSVARGDDGLVTDEEEFVRSRDVTGSSCCWPAREGMVVYKAA